LGLLHRELVLRSSAPLSSGLLAGLARIELAASRLLERWRLDSGWRSGGNCCLNQRPRRRVGNSRRLRAQVRQAKDERHECSSSGELERRS